MADVKKLQTRIALKYDTYANWTNEEVEGVGANLVLLKGEIGICEIPSKNAASNVAPTVLFKVGNGEKIFKELPWASAKAADVYNWAKASDVVVSGKTIKFVGGDIDSDGNKIDKVITLNFATPEEVAAAVKVVSDDLTSLTNRVAAVEGKFTGDASVEGQIDALKTRVGDVEDAIDLINDADEGILKQAKDYTDAREVEIKKYADQAEADAITEAGKAAEALVATERTRIGSLEGRATAVEGRLDAIEGDEGAIATAVSEALDAAKEYAEGQASAAQTAAQGYADRVAATAKSEAIAAAKTETESQIATLTTAVNTKDAELEGKIGDNTTAINNEKAAREEADTAINNKLAGIDTTVVAAIDAAKTAAINSAAATAQEKVDALANGQVNTNKEAIAANVTEIARVAGLVASEQERAEGVEEDFETRITAMEAFFEPKDAEGNDVEIKAALDTLVEIQKYITDDGEAAGLLVERVGAAETAIGDLEDEFAEGGRVTAAEGNITSLTTRMGAAESAIDTKLATETFNTWKGTHEDDHAKTATEITAEIGTAVAGEASARATAIQGAVDTLNGTINGVKTTAEDAQTRVGAVETRVGTVEGKVSTLEGSMTTAQGDITNLGSTKLDKATYEEYIAGKSMSDADLKKYAEDEADAAQTAANDYTDAEVVKLNAKDAELAGLISDNADAISAETEAREAAINTINGKLDVEKVSTAIATAKQEAIDAAATTAQGKVDALANGQVNTNKTDITNLTTRVGNIESDYLKAVDLFIIDCGSSTTVVHEMPSNN